MPQAILLPIGKIHQLDGRCPSMTLSQVLLNKFVVFLEKIHIHSMCDFDITQKDDNQTLKR